MVSCDYNDEALEILFTLQRAENFKSFKLLITRENQSILEDYPDVMS